MKEASDVGSIPHSMWLGTCPISMFNAFQAVRRSMLGQGKVLIVHVVG